VVLTWNTAGPREEERALAGKLAGALWLSVPPMLAVGLLLPGGVTRHWELLTALTIPAFVWGLACLFLVRWNELKSPLFFHVPAVLTLPYIGVLIASTGVMDSPYALTLLMLLSFCAYFFPARVAVAYLLGCLAVHSLPLVYDTQAVDSGLLGELWVAIFVYAAVGGVIIVGKNQLLRMRAAADELSRRDSLTGLANRRALTEMFARDLGGARRQDKVGLLLVDLDDFKEINTLHGLPGGDRVLCAVADALRAVSRSGDVVARLGGDEFAMFLQAVDERGMHALARRVLAAVREAGTRASLPELELTASAGWGLYPQDADSAADLMTVADLSLRAAKLNGKNRAQSPLDWATEEPEFA
jgi:diguanylate cyclase (GGDEF)-like protein